MSARSRSALLLLSTLVVSLAAHAQLRLPAILSDHAMLQAGKPIAVWGWAAPGAHVSVTFNQASFTAIANAAGKWQGHLPAQKDGAAGALTVRSDKDPAALTVSDVLIGEVWLGGGQSNMVYALDGNSGIDRSNPEEVAEVNANVAAAKLEAAAEKPPIRYFLVTSGPSETPKDDVEGKWLLADATNVAHVSAVAWNFAVAIADKTHLPVGLVISCVGGTPVQSWMSKETLLSTSVGAAVLKRHADDLAATTPAVIAKADAEMKAWEATHTTPEQRDTLVHRPYLPYTRYFSRHPIVWWNGRLHGLEPYTLRGVIWFQADGNNSHPSEYGEMFRALIREWRAEFDAPTLPFYFVEMNNMNEPRRTLASKPVTENALSLIREQQHQGLLEPHTAMVAAIDVGTRNAHFPNKKPVGQRLAALALRDCYGVKTGEVNSPIFRGDKREGNKVRLYFSDAEGLRTHDGGAPVGFAIRGATGDWQWAQAKIDGQSIVVWNDSIPAPVAVRYAWAQNPLISVENGAGLPLYPFRTDTQSPK
jgi:sialate O-acetylesterase